MKNQTNSNIDVYFAIHPKMFWEKLHLLPKESLKLTTTILEEYQPGRKPCFFFAGLPVFMDKTLPGDIFKLVNLKL